MKEVSGNRNTVVGNAGNIGNVIAIENREARVSIGKREAGKHKFI